MSPGVARTAPRASYVDSHPRSCIGLPYEGVPWRSGGGRGGTARGLLCPARGGRSLPGLVPGRRRRRRRPRPRCRRSAEPTADDDAHRPGGARQGVLPVSRDRRRAAWNREADTGDGPSDRAGVQRHLDAAPLPAAHASRFSSTRSSACRGMSPPRGSPTRSLRASLPRRAGRSLPSRSRPPAGLRRRREQRRAAHERRRQGVSAAASRTAGGSTRWRRGGQSASARASRSRSPTRRRIRREEPSVEPSRLPLMEGSRMQVDRPGCLDVCDHRRGRGSRPRRRTIRRVRATPCQGERAYSSSCRRLGCGLGGCAAMPRQRGENQERRRDPRVVAGDPDAQRAGPGRAAQRRLEREGFAVDRGG